MLITHEHADHVDALRLAGPGIPISAPDGARLHRVLLEPIQPGQTFVAAGFEIAACGGLHAPVIADQPSCANLGYFISGLFHPGDALTLPPTRVDTLLVPMQASWLKTAEAIEFLRAAAPERAIGIHDGQINQRAVESISGWLASVGPFTWQPPGTVTEDE